MKACAKHRPGDGIDERDQHMVTTHNTLSIQSLIQLFDITFRNGRVVFKPLCITI